MPDTLAIAGMIQSFKTLADLGKAILSLRDAELVREKVIELNREVLAALQSAYAAQTDQFEQRDRIRELETQIASLKAWDTEKQKYQLGDLRPPNLPPERRGAFAYTLKKEISASEPIHSICPDCYEDGRKSILQQVTLDIGKVNIVSCHRCGLQLNLTGIEYREQPTATKPRPRR